MVIQDTPGVDGDGNSNQLLLRDTFKVYEVNLKGVSKDSAPTEAKTDITGSNLYKLDFNEDGTFKITFNEKIDKAYKIEYTSVFLGKSGDTISNEAIFTHSKSDKDNTKTQNPSWAMTFWGTGHTTKVQLWIQKVDTDNNVKLLDGAKFELWGVLDRSNGADPNAKPTVKLTEGVTDGGYIKFPQKMAQGYYFIKEKGAPTGYNVNAEYAGEFGKKIYIEADNQNNKNYVHTELVKNELKKCEVIFINKDKDGNTITTGSQYIVKDKDSNPIKDASGNEINETNPLTAGSDGKIILPRLPAGEYTIEQISTPNGYYANEDPIKFKVDPEKCLGDQIFTNEKIPTAACIIFTIIVKGEDGNLIKEKEVEIKDPVTKKVIKKGKTDTEGKITILNTVKPGSYVVYENGKELGTVLVDFTGNCEAPVKLACPLFVITVVQEGVKAAEGTQLVIKDAAGTTELTTGIVDKDGKVTFNELTLPAGSYTVFDMVENNLGSITVNYEYGPCNGTVTFSPSCPAFTITVNQNGVIVKKDAQITLTNVGDSTSIVNAKTDDNGQIILPKADLSVGKYQVTDIKGKSLGEIDVLYAQGQCEATVDLKSNACPNFTLTVQDVYGNSRPNVDVTIKDGKGNTVATTKTDGNGVATIPYTVEPGVYYVYEGNAYINYITVTDTCSATVKPQTGGGGGWTPPPTEPPVNPEDPTPGKPDSEKPVNPGDPTPGNPDSEKPVNPGDPTPGNPDSEKPVNPEDPTPGNPDSEKPVNPEDPTPGDPGSEKPTNPENTTTGNPGNSNGGTSVQEIIDQGKKLPPYNATTTPSQDTLDKYKDFLNKYSKLSKEEQLAVGKSVDIDKIKAAAKQMEAQLAKGKLPQTSGADQTGMIAIGLLLVAASLFFLRRRNGEIK